MSNHSSQRDHINRKISIKLFAVMSALIISIASHAQGNQAAPTKPARTGYADVNGLHMYYEIFGQGQPLILLHGGFGNTSMFSSIMPILCQNRQVIAVDMQAHGRTADI